MSIPVPKSFLVWLATGLLGFAGQHVAGAAPTRSWEETVTLPTYKVAPPDPNPRFYAGRTYQGAKATFYPYPVSDQMTEKRENQDYKAVYLENDYIKFSVFPELGGRIFTALDKGNGYDFFYRQHVIKPALIGMLGAWISGGVEWNIPHHHRASSFMPVQYALEEHANGGKTIWVGETELRHRLRWILGMTLHPDSSVIDMTVKVFNRTPAAQSFLFWINPAVHANSNYQVIFPPSTQWTVQHGKPEFASWPIARQRYGGVDYSRGVDISWWKNHPSPVSFFAWDTREDFFGGYDHGKHAGVVHVANHHVSPGQKFFEWGNGPEGEMWSKILSDEDGHYLELMAGSYSDNQPDYSWIQPGEVKVFKHYWYPVRNLGGFKNANTEAAVNLETTNHTVHLAFNTTRAHPNARAVLNAGAKVLLDQSIRINPNQPFVARVELPPGVAETALKAALLDGEGRELIHFQPQKQPQTEKPQPVERPRPPREIETNEELYFTGLRIEQLYSPSYDPAPYYLEALRRDSGDYRANVALGSLYCRQGRFAEAESLLTAAASRASANYIRSKDCEAQYNLGVALRAQGKNKPAEKAFYRAVWDRAWQSPSYLALAELAAQEQDWPEALVLVEQSLENGSLNTRAIEAKAGILRMLGKTTSAYETVQSAVRIDPLSSRGHYELSLAAKVQSERQAHLNDLAEVLHGEVNNYLELAVDYANAGLHADAVDVLELYAERAPGDAANPLVYYYLGNFNSVLGNEQKAKEFYSLAAQTSIAFCFPFQHEAEPVLLHAITSNSKDARARYLLGNLLYDAQPERAIELWREAVELEPELAMAHRNLSFGLAQANTDLPAAVAAINAALGLEPSNARNYFELDVLQEAVGAPVEERLDAPKGRPDIIALRDDVTTRFVTLLIASGSLDQALEILGKRQFHNWEGSSSLHDVHVDAWLQKGLAHLRANEPEEALASFEKAKEYPENQQVGRPKREQRVAQIYYCVALAQKKRGRESEMRAALERAASANESSHSEATFFRALALQALDRKTEAETIYADLEKHGLAETTRVSEAVDYFAKFGEKRAERVRKAEGFFLAGLGCMGLGKDASAQEHFAKALELHPGHLGAMTWKEHRVPGM